MSGKREGNARKILVIDENVDPKDVVKEGYEMRELSDEEAENITGGFALPAVLIVATYFGGKGGF